MNIASDTELPMELRNIGHARKLREAMPEADRWAGESVAELLLATTDHNGVEWTPAFALGAKLALDSVITNLNAMVDSAEAMTEAELERTNAVGEDHPDGPSVLGLDEVRETAEVLGHPLIAGFLTAQAAGLTLAIAEALEDVELPEDAAA